MKPILARIQRAAKKDAVAYLNRSRQMMTVSAAASAWACGVPWAEALRIAQRATDRACPKPSGKAKAKPKAKAKAFA